MATSDAHPYIDKTHPATYKALVGLLKEVRAANKEAGLEPALTELVNLRASQLNGCVACMSAHAAQARRVGVEQVKLDILPGWRESREFSPQERAALGLVEALTRPRPEDPSAVTPQAASAEARKHFTDTQVAALEWTIITINAFNRVSIISEHPVVR